MDKKEHLKDYYSILDISSDSTYEEIRKSYKKLVLIYHPDINKSKDSTEKFKEVLKAYSVLKDNDLRKEYDRQILKNNLFFPMKNLKYECKKMKEKTTVIFQKVKLVFKNISSTNCSKLKLDDEIQIDVFDELKDIDVFELEDRLLYSDNPFVRYNAVITLGLFKSKSSYNILESSLYDESYIVRKGGIFALGEIGMKKSLHILKILYNSMESNLRIDIIKAVYKIAGKNSIIFNSLLLKGINDKSEEIRSGCLKLLLSINKNLNYKNIKSILDKMSFKVKENIEKMLYAI